MTSFLDTLVGPDDRISKLLEIINRNAQQIALVVDSERHLLGTVTDGDIRRGLLRGVRLDDSISVIMNSAPHTSRAQDGRIAALKRMSEIGVSHMPLVDEAGCVVGLEREEHRSPLRDELVVLMAGGRGTRLAPLTQTVPKPLVPVGGRPLLETSIKLLGAQGFTRFLLCLNYKSQMIRDHFGDGSDLGVEISYVEEPEQLGTAGALSLIAQDLSGPLIVMNGDILTTVDFRQVLNFHNEKAAPVTVCLGEYSHQIPYGVVRIEDGHILSMDEKPVHTVFVNAGIYVFEPQTLRLLDKGQHCDMPQFIERIRGALGAPAAFPIREYWLDVGRIDDLSKARSEFNEVFG